jgi:hypothetical protein
MLNEVKHPGIPASRHPGIPASRHSGHRTRSTPLLKVREAPFALRVVERKDGHAAIVYRRRADRQGRDRLQRVAAVAPLAYTAALPLLRQAVSKSQEAHNGTGRTADRAPGRKLDAGRFYALDQDWGARVACYGLVASGLRDAERLSQAGRHLYAADAAEAAWWLGLITRDEGARALRALRILVEAVE